MISIHLFALQIGTSSLTASEISPKNAADSRGIVPLSRIAVPGSNDLSLFSFASQNVRANVDQLFLRFGKGHATPLKVKVLFDRARERNELKNFYESLLVWVNEAVSVKSESSKRNYNLSLIYARRLLAEYELATRIPLRFERSVIGGDAKYLTLTGKIYNDLVVCILGLDGLAEEIRPILDTAISLHSGEPFFRVCECEEYTSAYRPRNPKIFSDTDYNRVLRVALNGIDRWPKVATFYLYAALAYEKKDQSRALPLFLQYRKMILAGGGTRLKNTDYLISRLKEKLKK